MEGVPAEPKKDQRSEDIYYCIYNLMTTTIPGRRFGTAIGCTAFPCPHKAHEVSLMKKHHAFTL